MSNSDEELVLAYAKGDESAFAELYARHKESLFRYCCFMLRDSEKAEEVLQKAFIRFFERIGQFTGPDSPPFKQWIFIVCSNLCKDELRRSVSKRTSLLENPDLLSGFFPDHVEALERQEERRRIGKALDQLPEKLRQVILLQYFADLDLKEIAGILKVPEGTVKSRSHKAKELLARLLGGKNDG
jgi:RNA polymerase sigma-70 factor (ECF subfamily)